MATLVASCSRMEQQIAEQNSAIQALKAELSAVKEEQGSEASLRAQLQSRLDGGADSAIMVLPQVKTPATTEVILTANAAAFAVRNEQDYDGSSMPESLTVYCVEQVMATSAPSLGAVLAMLQMCLITCAQLVLCFGFFDSVWLESLKGKTSLFGDSIEAFEFYMLRIPTALKGMPSYLDGYTQVWDAYELRRVFQLADGCDESTDETAAETCTYVPIINVLASVTAVVLLAAGPVVTDYQQTLRSVQPVDCLLFDSHTVFAQRYVALRLAWRVFAAAVMQLCWAVRVLLVPSMGLLGTAMSMTYTHSVFDIVLNAVAIGFVFDGAHPHAKPAARVFRAHTARPPLLLGSGRHALSVAAAPLQAHPSPGKGGDCTDPSARRM